MTTDNPLVIIDDKSITRFDPKRTAEKDAKLTALINYAKAMQNWPLLEEAVDRKIDEQIDFCKWWEKEVTPRKGWSGKSQVTEPLPEIGIEVAEWKMRVRRWKNYLNAVKQYRARLLGAEYKAALLDNREFYGEHENENEELFTPAEYIEAARSVLGSIDLDPASCKKAQETVKAKRYFTKKENGLEQKWSGRVWLNPPYSQPNITKFTSKLVDEVRTGQITSAIVLTNNHTDTEWFHNAESVAELICFTKGRIKFVDPVKGEVMPTAGQAFFYYGHDIAKFKKVFKQFGFVR